jgi:hypothetical protein
VNSTRGDLCGRRQRNPSEGENLLIKLLAGHVRFALRNCGIWSQNALMDGERELAIRQLLRAQELRICRNSVCKELRSMNLPKGSSVPPDDFITAMVELEDLRNELEFLHKDSSDSGEPEAFVGAPVKPPPHLLNSGAIALPEPDEPNR